LIFTFIVLHIVDLITTYFALKLGAYEVNPVANFLYKYTGIVGLGLFKLLGIVVFIFFVLFYITDSLIAYALTIIANIVTFAVVINNIYVILRIVSEKT